MSRWLALSLALYVPHLLEEHFTRMCDDPLIVAAFRPLSQLSAREASYLVFQVMFAVALAMTLLFSLGGRGRDAVLALLAVALLGEGHHLVRWLQSPHYNPGLWTSLPLPILGAFILRSVFRKLPQRSLPGELS